MNDLTNRNRFMEFLFNNEYLNSLSPKKKRERMDWIMNDVEGSGVFDPIDDESADEEEYLEMLADMVFAGKDTSSLISTKRDEVLKKQSQENLKMSMERIRNKRRELSLIPELEIVLDEDDLDYSVQDDREEACPYGRSPLHQAIATRNLEQIEEYLKAGKYIDSVDNNGNTPYQMTYFQRHTEALALFAKYSVAC